MQGYTYISNQGPVQPTDISISLSMNRVAKARPGTCLNIDLGLKKKINLFSSFQDQLDNKIAKRRGA